MTSVSWNVSTPVSTMFAPSGQMSCWLATSTSIMGLGEAVQKQPARGNTQSRGNLCCAWTCTTRQNSHQGQQPTWSDPKRPWRPCVCQCHKSDWKIRPFCPAHKDCNLSSTRETDITSSMAVQQSWLGSPRQILSWCGVEQNYLQRSQFGVQRSDRDDTWWNAPTHSQQTTHNETVRSIMVDSRVYSGSPSEAALMGSAPQVSLKGERGPVQDAMCSVRCMPSQCKETWTGRCSTTP